MLLRTPWRLLLVLSAAVAAAPAEAQTVVNRKYKETRLAPFPKEVRETALISPDGRHIAYVRDGNTAVFDGNAQKTYATVTALAFSPDSKWLAYAAGDGKKWFVVVSGREEAAYQRVGEPTFAPNSRRLAYVALLADNRRAVVDNGKPGKAYDQIFEGRIVFSPDGKRMAYGGLRNDAWHLVVDDLESPAVKFLGSATGIQFSKDGTQVACAVLNADKTWSVMLGGKTFPPYQEIGDVVLSADGRRLAYTANKGGKWLAVADDKEQKPYDTIGTGTLRFSPDAKALVYAAQADKKWRLVYNTREEPLYDGIADTVFSPDSKLLAYVAQVANSEMVVLNNRPQRIFDRIGGKTLVFSPNSKRLGYVGLSGRASFVVVDNKRKQRYDLVGYLNFTPDSEHFVYAATRGAKAFTVVDDAESAHWYDSIWNVRDEKILLEHRKKFHYLGVKNNEIYLVEEEID